MSTIPDDPFGRLLHSWVSNRCAEAWPFHAIEGDDWVAASELGLAVSGVPDWRDGGRMRKIVLDAREVTRWGIWQVGSSEQRMAARIWSWTHVCGMGWICGRLKADATG